MDEHQLAGAARVESYLSALTRASKTPGIQYLAVNATGVLFEYAGGWADIHRQVPVDTGTTMMAYSMSKTITAVAALQLVETGRVGLDDPVEQYVDSLPYGASVTVRQLISHTSGIPNPIPLRWVHHGTPFFYKEGGGGGFHCMMRLYAGDGIATVVMTNATGFDVRRLLDAIDASFLRSGQPRP